MNSSSCAMKTTTTHSSPRLTIYAGDPVIDGRLVPKGDGELPDDFAERLVRLKKAGDLTWNEFAELLGVELKQVLRWKNEGTKPSGGAHHSLVLMARWIPGGLDILMGDDFLAPHQGGLTTCPESAPNTAGRHPTS